MDEAVRALISQELPHTVKIRHSIHEYPELGFREKRTTALMEGELRKNGIEVVPIGLETGVLAMVHGQAAWTGPGRPPVIGIRADIDALPIEENTGKPYSSKTKGVMHACGHDGHTANLLGTAIVLQKLRGSFAGTVKFFFQPAEETLYGAQRMLECGVLDNPAVDNVIALHGDVGLAIGKIGVYAGPSMASADLFKIKMIGVGAHGAMPFTGADALSAAAQAVLSLQMIVAREVDANDRAVLSVCQLHSGDTFNVIPGEADIAGTVRCHSQEVRERIAARVTAICESVARSYRCEAQVDYVWGLPPTVNAPADIVEAAKKAISEDNIVHMQNPVMGSEDFSLFTQKVPSAIFRVGLGDGPIASLHNPGFDFSDEAFETAMTVFVQYVLDRLTPEER